MSIFVILVLLAAHFIGDWYLQEREDAVKKSTDLQTLQLHIVKVGFTTLAGFLLIGGGWWAVPLTIIYAFVHFYQDGFIYKDIEVPEGVSVSMYKPLWDRIALDQFLHLALLFLLASLI